MYCARWVCSCRKHALGCQYEVSMTCMNGSRHACGGPFLRTYVNANAASLEFAQGGASALLQAQNSNAAESSSLHAAASAPYTSSEHLRSQGPPVASTSGGPTDVQQMQEVVAANLPVFYFHPKEQYFPCTVEWFLQRCQLALIRRYNLSQYKYACRANAGYMLQQCTFDRSLTVHTGQGRPFQQIMLLTALWRP